MTTYGRRTHSWDHHKGKCRRCGRASPTPGERVGDCPAPRQVPFSRIRKERAAVWREASGIAMAHGLPALACRYDELADKEEL